MYFVLEVCMRDEGCVLDRAYIENIVFVNGLGVEGRGFIRRDGKDHFGPRP